MGNLALAIVWTGSAAAHTELESSHPSDGEIVDQPISQISLTFTRPVKPVSDGMIVFDEQGVEHKPVVVDSVDGQTWIMRFDASLPDSRFEVYWRVAAADGHILEGAFAFTVAAQEPEPTVSTPSATSPPATSTSNAAPPPATSTSNATPPPATSTSNATSPLDATSPGSAPDVDATPSVQSPTAAPAESASEGSGPSTSFSFTPPRSSATTGPQRIAEATRFLIITATLGIVGGLAFMAFIVRDEPLDFDRARRCVGASGIVLAASAAVAFLNRAVVIEREWSALWSADAIADAVSTHFGVAAGLRLVGGLIVVGTLLRAAANSPETRIVVTALMGGALVIASFAFDGHTVTEGPRWLHAIASVSHVSAAAVWSGGVALLADLLWRRYSRGTDVFRPLVRFSRMAATSLVLAGAAGTVMAILVLDRFADLWSTPWGRLLLAKIALVAVAAAIGGHNRWVLIPAVEGSGQSTVHRRLRRAALVEAIALLGIAAITAFLVAASAI